MGWLALRLMAIRMYEQDCAQSFAGMAYTGHQDADVSMFSFGTIKTATSFGGAILRVRDSDLLTEMKRREKR